MKLGNILLFISASSTLYGDSVIFSALQEKTQESAHAYQAMQHSCEHYLTLRDVPSLLARYVHGKKALDYGSGSGLTAYFLQTLQFDVVGSDISDAMVQEARNNYPSIPFYNIVDQSLPLPSASFDLVFSSFVVLCIASKQLKVDYFKEAHRLLKRNGIVMVITTNERFYEHDWLGVMNQYPENKNLKSGDIVKSYCFDASLEFVDYYWTHQDCIDCMQNAGFELVEIHEPLGKKDEPFDWQRELHSSPWVIFVARAV